MAYDVNKTDGTLLTSIADGTLDVSTSIRLVGKNYAGYGEVMAENLVAMLENFSYPTAPANPIVGQLWFNKGNKALSVFDTSGAWKEIANRYIRDSEPIVDGNRTGDFWFNPVTKTLYVWDGSKWVMLGFPDSNTIVYSTIRDVNGLYHDVIIHYNTEKVPADPAFPTVNITATKLIMAIMSADEFTPASTETAIIGEFPVIGKGLNLPIRTGVKFRGVAVQAEFADVAEYYESDVPYAPGTVIKLGGEKEVTQTQSEADDQVFGVVSTDPAFILNGAGLRKGAALPVALTGRVPVQVVGPVWKGARLVSSSLPGIAKAVERPDPYTVIGRSLVNSDEQGVRLVEAVVGVR
jgi:hypothetical protein